MNSNWKRLLGANALVFAAFLLTAQLGAYLYAQAGTSPAIIWAPVGIALAATLIRGYSILPGIGLAVIANGLLSEAPPFLIMTSTIANILQPAVAYFVLDKLNFQRRLVSLKDMFLLLGVSVFATMIVPTGARLAIKAYNIIFQAELVHFWLAWWIGGALSALAMTPLLLRWLRRPAAKHSLAKKIEATISIAALCVVSYFLFGTQYATLGGFSLVYVLLFILIWMAFRTGSRTMTLALFLMTVISLTGALYGDYVPTAGGLSRRVFNTQIFNIVVGAMAFILVSLEEQRKRAIAGMREHERELQGAMERIQSEDQAKNDFIAILAHELRNPLATFLSSTEVMMHKNAADPELQALAEMMRGRIKTMARLLDDLLDVSRITRNRLELKKEPIELSVLVRRAVRTVDASIKKKRQNLSVYLPLESVTVYADSFRLEQALVNLLSNASKYSPIKGRIELTCKYADGWLSLSVTDNGQGMDAETLARIFEPFVRGKSAGRRTEGLGIGLALAKSLVEMHGGTITAFSEGRGQGSRFTVRLPAREAVAPQTSQAQELREQEPRPLPTRAPNGDGLHILIVDDNQDAAHSLAKLLALQGHKTSLAYDGYEALERAGEANPDVILLDIGLPDIEGYEVARRLLSQGTDATLVALTGYGQTTDIEKAREAGFDHHLTKPVGLEDIENAFRELGLGNTD